MKAIDAASEANTAASAGEFFPHGTEWARADFHLHTRADKEFAYGGDETQFVTQYVRSSPNRASVLV